MDEPIAELESDKATLELPAEKAGTVTFVASEGDDLEIGAMVCIIDTSASGGSGDATPTAETKTETPTPIGSGKDGRILKEDVVKAVDAKKATPAKKEVPKKQAAPVVKGERGVRREKMSRLRRTIAKHLVNAKNNTAMLTTFNEVDLTEVKAIRAKYKEQFKEKHEIGLGFMSFFTRACSMAMSDFPAVNAQLDEDHVLFHDFVDISIAVSTPKGLVTPVIRNAESLTLQGIEQEVRRLALLGRDGKLTLDDMDGGTFTISNGGVFGSMMSTPIINAPQTAILGMHTIQNRPMAINGEVVIRPMMYLALSYDHRIIDGKEAVSFLVRVKQLLEDPIRMMLNV
ncbi:UNVERIFIED_CONTAM: hypothetical protein GTU68_049491 [Idotea baltica]|nr:hypothetical protein [Idotea baltica]